MLQIGDGLEGIDKDDELLEGSDKECELLESVHNEGEKNGKVVEDVETDYVDEGVKEGEGVECVKNEFMEEGVDSEGEKEGGEEDEVSEDLI